MFSRQNSGGGTRTHDPRIMIPLLYQLSYPAINKSYIFYSRLAIRFILKQPSVPVIFRKKIFLYLLIISVYIVINSKLIYDVFVFKKNIQLLTLIFSLPLLSAPNQHNPEDRSYSSKEFLPKMSLISAKEIDSDLEELLNDIKLISGESLEVRSDYIDKHKRSDILEALEAAKSTNSEFAIIKEPIIGNSFSKLVLKKDADDKIVELVLVNYQNPWLPILEKILESYKKSSKKERYSNSDSDSVESDEDYWCDNEIQELERMLSCKIDSQHHDKPSFYLLDEDGYLAYYNNGARDVMRVMTFMNCVEECLKPHVKFDESGMSYGYYLSPEVVSIINSVQHINEDRLDHSAGTFPVWLERLIHISSPEYSIGINIRAYIHDYKKEQNHPLLQTMLSLPMSSIELYAEFLNQEEKDIVSRLKEVTKLLGDFDYFFGGANLNAICFRSLILIKDLEELNKQMALNINNSEVYNFISNLKERHISQFRKTLLNRIFDENEVIRAFIMKIVTRLKEIPEFEEIFHGDLDPSYFRPNSFLKNISLEMLSRAEKMYMDLELELSSRIIKEEAAERKDDNTPNPNNSRKITNRKLESKKTANDGNE